MNIDRDIFTHLTSDKRKGCPRRDCCHKVIDKRVEVSTPVEIDVQTRQGDIRVTCSQPRVSGRPSPCPGRTSRCDFVVHQVLCVEIPISYCVQADIGESYVDCDIGAGM